MEWAITARYFLVFDVWWTGIVDVEGDSRGGRGLAGIGILVSIRAKCAMI